MRQMEEGCSSPRRAVEVKECIEELLKFILHSSIDQTLDFDLGLSTEFCSHLLRDDDSCSPYLQQSTAVADSSKGIACYPLYKSLASALHESITSGLQYDPYNKCVEAFNEDNNLKQKDEWNEILLDKGSELVNILNTINFELHVQEPFFTQLKDGSKTIEGRCAAGDYKRIESGALIFFNKCVVFEVKDVHRYNSFSDMLRAESLLKVLPGITTVEQGVQIYRKFYTEEKEKLNGVLAICLSKHSAQPYVVLASLLCGLSYEGIQSLLGLAHTAGTIPDALSPPRSILLSSFNLLYKPNVKGQTLTHGARALAKHANRSSDKYWGSFVGNDSNKNRCAMDVINRLVVNCCWLNVHIVPLHGIVFEIRDVDGYGARWSKDGSKFIGFLEPYMEDGHSRGWKH